VAAGLRRFLLRCQLWLLQHHLLQKLWRLLHLLELLEHLRPRL
jgi:hypothetical protein